MSRPPKEPLKSIGRAIRLHREGAGLTQADLAEAVDISVQYVGLLERGAAAPSLETLASIAAALKAPLREFFLLEDAGEEEEIMASLTAIVRPLDASERRRALRILRAAFHDG